MEDMGAGGWAAIIGAVTAMIVALATAIGTAIKYVMTLILDAYKGQAKATTDAKDRELAAKDARIEKIERERAHDREIIAEQRETIRDLRSHVRDLKDQLTDAGIRS